MLAIQSENNCGVTFFYQRRQDSGNQADMVWITVIADKKADKRLKIIFGFWESQVKTKILIYTAKKWLRPGKVDERRLLCIY